MDDLAVPVAVVLDEDVAIDERGAVGRVRGEVVGIDEVELAVAGFDPVVSHDQTCRAVLEIVAGAAGAQRPEVVELKGDALGLRVVVVLVDRALDAVIVYPTALYEHRARPVRGEEAVPAVVEDAVPDRHVRAALDEDRRAVGGVGGRVARVVGEGVGRAARRDVQVLDDDPARHVRRNARTADLDHRAGLAPEIELEPRSGVLADDPRELAARPADSLDGDRRGGGASAADDPFLPVGLGPPVDADGVAGGEGLPGHGPHRVVGPPRADLVHGAPGAYPREENHERCERPHPAPLTAARRALRAGGVCAASAGHP